MKKMTKLTLASALLFSAPVALACDYPTSPKNLPDGATASKEEMLAGVKVIANYQEDMAAYLSCIEADEALARQAVAGDEDGTKQRELMFDKKYNAAVDDQTRTVEMFNAEIRAYKAAAN